MISAFFLPSVKGQKRLQIGAALLKIRHEHIHSPYDRVFKRTVCGQAAHFGLCPSYERVAFYKYAQYFRVAHIRDNGRKSRIREIEQSGKALPLRLVVYSAEHLSLPLGAVRYIRTAGCGSFREMFRGLRRSILSALKKGRTV